MNTERNGGARDGSADPLQERLARRFDSELAQAERDYPSLSVAGRTAAAGRRRTNGLSWPRLASGIVAVGVLAVVGLIGAGLASRPAEVAGPDGSNPPRPGDGIPAQIGGQRVYRVTDKASFPTTGVYLVGGYLFQEPAGCVPASDLNGPCYRSGCRPFAGRHGQRRSGPVPGRRRVGWRARGRRHGGLHFRQRHALRRTLPRTSSGPTCPPSSTASASIAPPIRLRSRPRAASCSAGA